jgi:hypothetical protein
MTSFQLVRLVAAVLTGIASSLHAEDKSTTWDIRVAAVDILPGHDTVWLRTGPGTKPVRVPLNIRIFSPPIRHKAPAKAAFFRSEAEALLVEPPTPLVTAALTSKSVLIVFAPRPDGAGYQAMVVDDSVFPYGSFRFVNGSSVPTLVEIDGKRLAMKPGAAETVTYKEAKSSLHVRIATATEEGKGRLIRQTSWSTDLSQRELIFLMPGSAPGLVSLRHFIDSKTE